MKRHQIILRDAAIITGLGIGIVIADLAGGATLQESLGMRSLLGQAWSIAGAVAMAADLLWARDEDEQEPLGPGVSPQYPHWSAKYTYTAVENQLTAAEYEAVLQSKLQCPLSQ